MYIKIFFKSCKYQFETFVFAYENDEVYESEGQRWPKNDSELVFDVIGIV